MKAIGVIYAISKLAGDLCKKNLENQIKLIAERNIKIITDEANVDKYKGASDEETYILLKESVKNLQNSSSIIILAANSVHRCLPRLRKWVSSNYPHLELLSMVDATVNECKAKNIKKVTIFASNKTITSNLYTKPLEEAKISVCLPINEDQKFIDTIINLGIDKVTSLEKDYLKKISDKLIFDGAQACILACAELPILFNSENLGLLALDTNDLIARYAIKRILRLDESKHFPLIV